MTTPENKEATQKTSNPKVVLEEKARILEAKASVNPLFLKIVEMKNHHLGNPVLAKADPKKGDLLVKALFQKADLKTESLSIKALFQEVDPKKENPSTKVLSQKVDLMKENLLTKVPSLEEVQTMTGPATDHPSLKSGLKTKDLQAIPRNFQNQVLLLLTDLKMANQEKTETSKQVENVHLATNIKNRRKTMTSNIRININSDLLISPQTTRLRMMA